MLGLIFLFLCGWLIYASLCRLVFGKPDATEYYIVREYDIEVVVDEVMERLSEAEQEQELELESGPVVEELCELPDNVILFDKHR
jgi:hypothetical protein